MERAFERIELPEAWWEIWVTPTRGMRKMFRAATMNAIAGKVHLNGNSNDPEALKAALVSQMGNFDLNLVDDGYLVHGTKAWSWPEPVTAAFIDTLPDPWVEKVLGRMRELYSETPEEAQKKDTAAS